MRGMIRQILAVGGGFLTLVGSAIFVIILPPYASSIGWALSMLTGSVIAGWIAQRKGWLSGTILAIVLVVGEIIGAQATTVTDVLPLALGPLGGYLGARIATRRVPSEVMRHLLAIIGGMTIAVLLGGGKSRLSVAVGGPLAILGAGIFAGYIGRRRGWVLGTAVVLVTFLVEITVARRIVAANRLPPPAVMELLRDMARYWRTSFLPLLLGPLGGYLGGRIAMKRPEPAGSVSARNQPLCC